MKALIEGGSLRESASVQAFRCIRAATRGAHCRPLDPRLASLCSDCFPTDRIGRTEVLVNVCSAVAFEAPIGGGIRSAR
jgi:hypothetical protein